ncbi:trypsin-like peptidase domain-containing protein [Microcoleus sp. FACHB-68]|uniref:nSTAND1 domain-containing NTPase n=1 Tax=Microcoleus sp. FACHB-68 TaxID=2692826 RepID=UPI001688E224|nr:trypsin-like peptidase domain-containing protein [Microcoleus sp. FACHB-68]MBD1938807.1 trypsin-like peptidase domain-containing protein [Microcoleus sp. FACHB-68]
MPAPLESSVVRIYSKSQKVVGAGFLVSSKYILTCAHVAADALGISRTTQEQPEGVINLDFPLLAVKQMFAAKVIFWQPVNPNQAFEDIAGLELETDLPDTAQPAQLVTSEDLWGHPFRVLGFPAGQPNGVSASGVLRGRIANGWVQLEDVKQPGYRLEPGFSGAPVWDEELQGVAGMAVAAEMNRADVKAAFIIPTGILVSAWSDLGKQAIPSCPYRGLFAFREQDAQFFFGRETFTEQLVAAVQRQQLVAVIGSSGSGKSSVVFAGCVPQLREQGDWLINLFRPGERPFRNLAAALVPLLETQMSETDQLAEINKLAKTLRLGDVGLQDVVTRILEKNSSTCLLLVADQFEELYTLCKDGSECQLFLDRLLEALNEARNFRLVLTLRADFLGYALSYRPFADALQNTDVKLGPMNRQEFQDVIEKPTQKQGVKMEQGLTKRILDAVGEEPGNLPLLEFALTQLWKKQRDGKLTHAAYDAIGGVEKALSNHAEEVYAQFSVLEHKQAQKIFIQLVRPGEGTPDIRRQATRAEVGEENWDLVKRLADERLVVSDRKKTTGEAQEETVEIVHEALIREWQRLRKWMKEDRAFRLWQERLRTAMRQWETTDKDDGALLGGFLLSEAEAWQQQRLAELSQEERVFIQLSLALRDREKNERIRLRQHITLGLVIGLSITTALAVFTYWQWRLAEAKLHEIAVEQEHRNLANQIAKVSLVSETEGFAVTNLSMTKEAVWMTLVTSKDEGNQEGKGLMRYDLLKGGTQTYLEGNSVTALLVEKKDIWVGVSKGGVRHLRHGSFQNGDWKFTDELVSAPGFVSSLVRDQQNRLWVGTFSGVCLQKSGQCQIINEIQSLCPALADPSVKLQVYQMIFDTQRSVLWIATDRGLVRWSLEKLSGCYWDKNERRSPIDSLPDSLKSITLDNSGHLWAGTSTGEAKRFAKGIDTPARTDDIWDNYHVTSEQVTAIAALPKGFFLAGTRHNGLFLYSTTTDTWLQVPLDLKKIQTLYNIVLGSDNHLWFATERGLYRSVTPIQIGGN